MMKTILWVCTSLSLLFPACLYAANSTLSGGSGLLVMRTAETLDRGAVDVSAFGWANLFRASGSPYQYTDVLFMPGINVGVVDNVEAGLTSPYLFNTDNSASGVSAVRGFVKYRFIHAPRAGVGVAVTAFGSPYAPQDRHIGSGKRNYGVELNISLPRLFEPAANFHVTLGYERKDIEDVTGGLTFERVNVKRLDVGFETPPLGRWTLSTEFLLSRWSPSVTNILVLPGIRYRADRHLELIVGLGVGVPRHEAPPGYRFLGGVSYVFGDGRPAAPPPGGK